MSNTPLTRRLSLGLGAAGLAVAAGAAAVLTSVSPTADAAVTAIAITGSDFRVGNTYTLHADLGGASVGLLVYWSDNGEDFSGPKVPWPVGEASIDWVPKTPGQHVLTASQGGSTNSIVVNVGTGTTTPPTTTTPPVTTPPTTEPTTPPTTTEPESGGSGSAGSGSAGSGSGTGSAGRILRGLLGSS